MLSNVNARDRQYLRRNSMVKKEIQTASIIPSLGLSTGSPWMSFTFIIIITIIVIININILSTPSSSMKRTVWMVLKLNKQLGCHVSSAHSFCPPAIILVITSSVQYPALPLIFCLDKVLDGKCEETIHEFKVYNANSFWSV